MERYVARKCPGREGQGRQSYTEQFYPHDFGGGGSRPYGFKLANSFSSQSSSGGGGLRFRRA